jgi:hypothetical protein
MRNQNVRGEAAIDRDAEIAIVPAQILLAAAAGDAGPTTDPGINGNIRGCSWEALPTEARFTRPPASKLVQ